jgi:hypothetical protein
MQGERPARAPPQLECQVDRSEFAEGAAGERWRCNEGPTHHRGTMNGILLCFLLFQNGIANKPCTEENEGNEATHPAAGPSTERSTSSSSKTSEFPTSSSAGKNFVTLMLSCDRAIGSEIAKSPCHSPTLTKGPGGFRPVCGQSFCHMFRRRMSATQPRHHA